jgi:hypothetical protein
LLKSPFKRNTSILCRIFVASVDTQLGLSGQLERGVEPASPERTAEHPEIINIIIAAFMQNMTGLTI